MAVVCVVTSALFSSPFRWKYLQNTMNILTEVFLITSLLFKNKYRTQNPQVYFWSTIIKRNFVQVDEKVGTLAAKKLQRIAVAFITCPLLYLIIISVLDYLTWMSSKAKKKMQFKPDKGPINYLPLYFMYFVITIFEVQYALSTFHIAERFSRLNEFIGRWLTGNKIS